MQTVAAAELALPHALLKTAAYSPASVGFASVIVSVAAVRKVGESSAVTAQLTVPPPGEAPEGPSAMGRPLRCHCTETLE